jgi:flagellar hook-length control protein FliK
MRTLPILANAANASLPSTAGVSLAAGAKTAEFFQVLQQWGSERRSDVRLETNSSTSSNTGSQVRSAANTGGDLPQAEPLSHGSVNEAATHEQTALPRILPAAATHSPSAPATLPADLPATSPVLLSATIRGSQEAPNIGNVRPVPVAVPATPPSATPDTKNVDSNVAVIPSGAANMLANTMAEAVVLNSGDNPKPGGAKKLDTKQAGANPQGSSQHITNQHAPEQPSSHVSVHSAATASVIAPSPAAVPLPNWKPTDLEPGAPASASLPIPPQKSSGAQPTGFSPGPLATPLVTPAATKTASQTVEPASVRGGVADAAAIIATDASAGTQLASSVTRPTVGVASAALGSRSKQSSSQTAQDATIAITDGDTSAGPEAPAGVAATEALTAAAASSAATSAASFATSFVTSLAPSSAAPLATSFPEPRAAQPNARPRAAITSAKTAPSDEATRGAALRSGPNSAQPIANPQPLPASKIFAEADPLNHILLRAGADASFQETKSSSRDENASHIGISSPARQTNNSADSSGDRNSSSSLTPAIHAQAASLQSATFQSSDLQNSGLPGVGSQGVVSQNVSQIPGGQAAGAPPAATAMVTSTDLPAPLRASTLPSAPQLPPNAAPGPAHMVDSGQLQVRGNGSELKISVQLPELGKVEVRAVTAHDVTTAHLTASHPDALQFLTSGRATLEQALKSRDVILGSLDSRGQNSQNQNSQNYGQTGERRQPGTPSSDQSSGGAPSTAATATTSAAAETTTGLLPYYSSISVRA